MHVSKNITNDVYLKEQLVEIYVCVVALEERARQISVRR